MIEVWKLYKIIFTSTLIITLVLNAVFLSVVSKRPWGFEHFVDEGNKIEYSYLDVGNFTNQSQSGMKNWDGGNVYQWSTTLVNVVYLISAAAILVCLLCFFTAYDSSARHIILMTLVLVFQVVTQFITVDFLIRSESKFYQEEQDRLVASLDAEYEVGPNAVGEFTLFLNQLMISRKCCGVRGPADFLNKHYEWSYEEDNLEEDIIETRRILAAAQHEEDPVISRKRKSDQELSASDDADSGTVRDSPVAVAVKAQIADSRAENIDKVSKGAQNIIDEGGSVRWAEKGRTKSKTKREAGDDGGKTEDGNNAIHSWKIKVPLACLKPEIRAQGVKASLAYAESLNMENIFQKGCYPTSLETVLGKYGEQALIVFLLFVSFEVLQIIMLTIFANLPKDFEHDAATLAVEYAALVESQASEVLDRAEEEHRQSITDFVLHNGDRWENKPKRRKTSAERRRVLIQNEEYNEAIIASGGPAAALMRQFVFVPHAQLSFSPDKEFLNLTSTEIW